MTRVIGHLAGWTALAALLVATPSWAQLGGLTQSLPSVTDRLPLPDRAVGLTGRVVDRALDVPSRINGLIRRSRGALIADPSGWPAIAGEIVVIDLSTDARDRAVAAGFTFIREDALPALGLTSTVLAPPRRLDLERAVERLRVLAPEADVTFNHVHAPAGFLSVEGGAPVASVSQAAGARLGLIDTGIDVTHPAFAASGVSPAWLRRRASHRPPWHRRCLPDGRPKRKLRRWGPGCFPTGGRRVWRAGHRRLVDQPRQRSGVDGGAARDRH